MISPLAFVDPDAQIGKDVIIHPFAYIDKNVVIGDNCEIKPYASVLNGSRLGSGNKVYQGAIVGAEPQDFNFKGDNTIVEIGNDNTIREKVIINRATTPEGITKIGNGNFFMEGVHISHDTVVGNECIIGNGTKVAGNCVIDDYAILSGSVLMHQSCRVGSWALIQGGCRFNKDIPPYIVAAREPIIYYGINAKVMSHHGFSENLLEHIASAYRIIYQYNNSIADAAQKIEEQVPMSSEIKYIVSFIRNSKRGIIR